MITLFLSWTSAGGVVFVLPPGLDVDVDGGMVEVTILSDQSQSRRDSPLESPFPSPLLVPVSLARLLACSYAKRFRAKVRVGTEVGREAGPD